MSTVTHRLRASAYSTPTKNSAPGQSSAEMSRHTAAHAVFLDITQTFGISFVPDLFVGMGARPAYLEAAWELFKEDLGLECRDQRTKLIIAFAITTDDAGTYYIAALPHAFRLKALDHGTCDRILSTIRFFNAFERYLSEIAPAYMPRNEQCLERWTAR